METRPATAWQTLRRRATRSLVAAVADATVTAEELEQFAQDCRSAAIDLVDLSARAQRAADERRGQ